MTAGILGDKREVFDMKKKELLKLTLAAMLCLGMSVAFIGCTGSDDQKTTEEATDEAVATEEAAEQTMGYDITRGLTVKEVNDMAVLVGNGFELTMPNTGTWSYEANGPDSVSVYYMDAKSAGFGGNLVSIMAMSLDDTSYEDFPDYAIAGESEALGVRWIALFPTDVQFDPKDETQATEYQELLDHVKMIGTSTSPFIAK